VERRQACAVRRTPCAVSRVAAGLPISRQAEFRDGSTEAEPSTWRPVSAIRGVKGPAPARFVRRPPPVTDRRAAGGSDLPGVASGPAKRCGRGRPNHAPARADLIVDSRRSSTYRLGEMVSRHGRSA
jgi:hypothetical protein